MKRTYGWVLAGLVGIGTWISAAEKVEGWQKIATQDLPMRDERQFVTPGLVDRDLQRTITLPPDGKPVEIALPHEGKDKSGKARPALMGSFQQGFVWLDLNGNGQQEPNEAQRIGGGAGSPSSGMFVFDVSFEDGTAGLYVFKLLDSGEAGKFRLLRCCAKQATIGRSHLVLFDDDGNGRYDDLGRDAVFIEGQPVTFLSRQILLEGKLHELLVHPAGQTLEIRPLEGLPSGKVNMFLLHKEPQKSESLKIHTLIISGREGSFGFDKKNPLQEIPAGAYDMVFGLFERAGEQVILKKGERTSFTVEAGKLASPAWGAPLSGKIQLESDGHFVTVSKPLILGSASEVYVPVSYETPPLRAYMKLLYREPRLNNTEQKMAKGMQKFDVLPNGDASPVKFEWIKNDELEFSVEFKSGILGTVIIEDRISFVHKRR